MPGRTALTIGVLAGTLVCCAATRGQAQSLGCYHMPSTVAQYLGYCYGAGHHAPIVKAPWQHPERVRRLALAPAAYGPLGPAPYEIYGCYGAPCAGPAMYPLPPPADAPMLAPAPSEARFEPGYRMARR